MRQFEYHIVYRPGKANSNADAFPDRPGHQESHPMFQTDNSYGREEMLEPSNISRYKNSDC